MKKIIAIILAAATVLCLFAACGKNKEEILTSGDYSYVVVENKDNPEDKTAKIVKYNGAEEVDELTVPSEFDGVPVTVIGESAFEGSEALKKVNLPKDLKTIEKRAFAGSSIFSVFVLSSNDLDTIEAEAFKDCAKLVQVDIKTVNSIGKDAFAGCSALVVFTLRSDVELSPDSFTDSRSFKFVIHKECEKVSAFAESNGYEVQIF